MALKDKIKRASKIFSNESKEALDKQLKGKEAAKDSAEGEVKDTTEEAAAAGETKVEQVVAEGETKVEEVVNKVEGESSATGDAVAADVEEAQKEVEAKGADAAAEAEDVAKETEDKAKETAGDASEEAKAQVKDASEKVEKAHKKNVFFKKFFSKFSKTTSAKN